jgi:hypothetical protein
MREIGERERRKKKIELRERKRESGDEDTQKTRNQEGLK